MEKTYNVSFSELAAVLVIILFVFGPGKLPEVVRSIGKGVGEVRRSINTESHSDNKDEHKG